MSLRSSKPWFFENSKLVTFLQWFSPIQIGAITLGPFVFSKGIINEGTKNHEAIHWQQYIEMGIIGFIPLYLIYWLIGIIKYKNKDKAYMQIPFEQEAYENHSNPAYNLQRKRWGWLKYRV